MSAAVASPLGWALVYPTLGSTEYIPVAVTRKTKRFAYVRSPSGDEWRYSARGFWDGMPTREAAVAEIDKMRAAAREHYAALHAGNRVLHLEDAS